MTGDDFSPQRQAKPGTSLWRNVRLATLAQEQGLGLVEDGALLVKDGRIAYAVLPRSAGRPTVQH